MTKLIFQTSPQVTFATNEFINVPTILQFDDTPLISVVSEQDLGYTSEFSIYHPDGTYLAKVNGTRVYPTKDGKKAGIVMRSPQGMTVCEMDGKTLFEIFHEAGDAFKAHAELYTPTGCFIKSHDLPAPEVIGNDGNLLKFAGLNMSNCRFVNCRIGILLKSDGSCAIGVG